MLSGIGKARSVMRKVTELEVCLRESLLSRRGWLTYRLGLFRKTAQGEVYNLSPCWGECRSTKVPETRLLTLRHVIMITVFII